MPAEIALMRSRLEGVSKEILLERTFYKGDLQGNPVVLVQSGIGKTRSAITATLLASHFGVRGIIFTGVAGSLNPAFKTGDVLLAHEAREHDFGTATPTGFQLGLDFLPGEEYQPQIALPDYFSLAMALLNSPEGLPVMAGKRKTPQIQSGIVATGDIFVANSDISQQIIDLTAADVVEMEGTAVIRVAKAANIPCLLVRTVSDDGDSDEFLDFFEAVAHNSAAIAEALIAKL